MLHLLFLFQFILFFSFSHEAVQDFCVGDLKLPQSPTGYACKDPAHVTVDDFVFTGSRMRGNTSNIFKASVTAAFGSTFPGVNGLGLSMGRIDLDVGGVIPLHSHRGGSEILVVIEGSVIGGFISTEDVPYYKLLRKGDVMIFPQGLLHFLINKGKVPALAFVSLNSATPGLQITLNSLFGNDLPPEYAEMTTLINRDEVRRLKALLGGSG